MIDIIPAIDLINGECVRLTQGDFNQKTVYSKDPLKMARRFETNGFKRLHLVDLDGAKSGIVKNLEILKKISDNTSLIVDYGGGIDSIETAKRAFDYGACLINIGSLAVKNKEEVSKIIEEYDTSKIIIAADVNKKMIAVSGWQETSNININKFIQSYYELGIRQFLCTDIAKDGTLTGTNLDLYTEILENFPGLYLIASGGVSSLEDIKKLKDNKVPAVVVGKAIYEDKINLKDLNAL